MIQGHRRLSYPSETPDGNPLLLTGKPLTMAPILVRDGAPTLKQYSEYFVPGNEELGPNEIRLTCCGSGNPQVRRAQAATSWLCELGNGDKFVFDVGGGTVQNLLTVINITPEQIVTRMAQTNLLHWTPPGISHGTVRERSEAKIPQWLVESVMAPIE